MNANIPNSTRKAVYRRDGYLCALCGSGQYLQIHHVIPRGEGGSDFPENLITLCSKCHAQAHGIDVYATGEDGYPTQADVIQACVEYMADMYTEVDPDGTTHAWYPFK